MRVNMHARSSTARLAEAVEPRAVKHQGMK